MTATIIPFLQGEAFEPRDIRAMSMALDDVCKDLRIHGHASSREILAIRIIELARRGERSPTKLRDRLLEEARSAAEFV